MSHVVNKARSQLVRLRAFTLIMVSLITAAPLAVAYVALTPGSASAYVSGCTLSRNWENRGGAQVNNADTECGYPSYGYLYATYSDPATDQAGYWYNIQDDQWVEGTLAYQYVADSTTADVQLISVCYPCTMYAESGVSQSAWVTEEY